MLRSVSRALGESWSQFNPIVYYVKGWSELVTRPGMLGPATSRPGLLRNSSASASSLDGLRRSRVSLPRTRQRDSTVGSINGSV